MSGARIQQKVRNGVRKLHAKTGDGTVLKCTIIRAGEADTTTYPPTPGTEARYEAVAYQSKFTLADRQGLNISASDVKIIAVPPFVNAEDATDTTEPSNGDRLEWKGVNRSVVEIMPMEPSTVAFRYAIQARSGG